MEQAAADPVFVADYCPHWPARKAMA